MERELSEKMSIGMWSEVRPQVFAMLLGGGRVGVSGGTDVTVRGTCVVGISGEGVVDLLP